MLNSIKMMYVTYFNTPLVSTVLALFSCFHIYSTLRRLFRRYWLFLLISMRTPIRLLFGSIYQIKSTVTNEFWVLWIFGSSSEKSLTAGTAYCAKISNASNQFWSFSMGMKNQINDLRIRYINLTSLHHHWVKLTYRLLYTPDKLSYSFVDHLAVYLGDLLWQFPWSIK